MAWSQSSSVKRSSSSVPNAATSNSRMAATSVAVRSGVEDPAYVSSL